MWYGHSLKPATACTWRFRTISDFEFQFLAPIVDPIIGDFFIDNVANKTLRCMKAYLEAQSDRVTA